MPSEISHHFLPGTSDALPISPGTSKEPSRPEYLARTGVGSESVRKRDRDRLVSSRSADPRRTRPSARSTATGWVWTGATSSRLQARCRGCHPTSRRAGCRRSTHSVSPKRPQTPPRAANPRRRDFYSHVLVFHPRNAKSEFQERYRGKIKWSYAEKRFERWCEGQTGFPLVDAGMRQLKREGWMHNRARLVVGSFLTKDLGIDWRWGERHFMRAI